MCTDTILMIGPFPPPLTGNSYINNQMKRFLEDNNRKILALNSAPKTLSRSFYSRIKRLKVISKIIHQLLFVKEIECNVLYMSISGGLGQLYEILFLLLLRPR